MIIDAHCHLQDERILHDLPRILAAAEAVGVKRFFCCGTEEADWQAVLALHGQHATVNGFLGLHPWHLQNRSEDWLDTLRSLLESDPSLGVGEIGLDHALDNVDIAEQYDVFRDQLCLARQMARPVAIHCRRAWAALLAALDEVPVLPAGIFVHAFSGSVETMHELIKRGVCISLSGSVTRRHNRRVRAVAAAVPDDNLLVETDAPDIIPFAPRGPENTLEPVSDGPNLPEYIVHVVRELAAIRGTSTEAIAALTTRNARRLIG